MLIKVKRIFKGPEYTIGHLYIDDEYFCDTIEDVDRGLKQTMDLNLIFQKKIYGETAIPAGTYNIDMNTVSPKYKNNLFYKKVCQGKLPRLIDVPGFSGVLIHVGNTAKDSAGCILVGENKVKGKVINSKVIFEKFYNIIKGNKKIILNIG